MLSSRRIASALLALACCSGSALALRAAIAAPPDQDSRSIVDRLYRARDAGDLKSLTALVDDGATWTYYGPEHILPFAGTFKGPEGVGEFFRILDEVLAERRTGQREYLVAGSQVTVPGWEEGTVKSTGARYRVDNVHLFTVQDGKITKFEGFVNSSDVGEGFMPADPARGQALFTTCAGCHGAKAEGRPELRAPNLAGLGTPYLVRQLRNFRGGLRGNASDAHGFMMIGPATALPGDRGVRDVAAFISKLPTFDAPASVTGNATRGRRLYEACAACHGMRAEGNDQTSAPPLHQLDDRYMMAQLEQFSSGARGAAAGDQPGQQMRAAISALPDTSAVRDVIAYIKSLEPPPRPRSLVPTSDQSDL